MTHVYSYRQRETILSFGVIVVATYMHAPSIYMHMCNVITVLDNIKCLK